MLSTDPIWPAPEDVVVVALSARFAEWAATESDLSDASTTKYKLSATTSVVIVIASANDFIVFALPT
jgi:hypothetical protein